MFRKKNTRKAVFILIIVVGLLATQLGSALAATNYIKNGGAEADTGLTDDWLTWSLSGNVTQYSVDSSVSRSGSRSFKIEHGATTDISKIHQWFELFLPGGEYVYSGWIKTENISGGDRFAHLDVVFYDDDYNTLGAANSAGVPGTEDWTYVTIEFTVPRGTTKIDIGFLIDDSTGTAWFDDLELVEADEYKAPSTGSGSGSGSGSGASPATGDNTFALLFAALGLTASIAFITTLKRAKNK